MRRATKDIDLEPLNKGMPIMKKSLLSALGLTAALAFAMPTLGTTEANAAATTTAATTTTTTTTAPAPKPTSNGPHKKLRKHRRHHIKKHHVAKHHRHHAKKHHVKKHAAKKPVAKKAA
ncbi:hypothetical protein [Mesorhizobium sp.]|uniref:hypothetical protein n=1 Tax=Mesorhizobium sp. TaxID=1871066 RepID=UPI0025BEE416|nr:hypothetical protein [Mesorhizobium sp.]